LENKRQAIIESKKQIVTNIDTEVVSEIVDLRRRTNEISYNIDNKTRTDENFSRLEALILNDVYLDNYEYNYVNNTVNMVAVTGSYQTVAEQMLNLTKSGYFSSVDISNTRRNKDGQVVFNLELMLAKK
jgi:hypothetical protein